MRRTAAVMTALAIAVLAVSSNLFVVSIPASAQSKSAPVKNALVFLLRQDNSALRSIVQQGGAPTSVERSLSLAEALLSENVVRAPTDVNGTFAILAPPDDGTYDVAVSAPGYVEAASGMQGSGSIVNVGGKLPQSANLTLVVQPSAVLSGRVTDSRGNPLAGIVVSAGDQPNSANYDVTTDDGVFVLDTGLGTGQQIIHAFKPQSNLSQLGESFSASSASSSIPLVSTTIQALNITASQQGSGSSNASLFPLLNSPGPGFKPYHRMVTLEQGKLTTLNIQLEDSQVISGTVKSKDSVPLAGIGVFAFDNSSGALVASTVSNSSGHYRFDNGLGPGTYVVGVPAAASSYFAPSSRTVTLPSIDQESVNFALDFSKEIRGKVVDDKGRGIGGATVVAVSLGAGGPQAAISNRLGAGTGIAVTGPDGAFLMNSGIAQGRYRLSAYYGDAIPIAGSSIVTAGDAPVTVRLGFSDTVSISGTVTDTNGRPIAGAKVLPSFATSIPASDGFAAMTTKNGTFEMKVPITDPNARTLFDKVVVSARGFASSTANLTSTSTAGANGSGAAVFSGVSVKMSPSSGPKLTGRVVTQESDSPPLAAALVRDGSFVVNNAQPGVGSVSANSTGLKVTFKTNSRVVGAAYDFQAKSVTMNFEGMQGPGGRIELSIPKALMTGPFSVVLDGVRINAKNITASENQTYSTIAFEHDHGLSQAIIELENSQAVPEFSLPSAQMMAAVVLSAMVLLAAGLRRISRRQ